MKKINQLSKHSNRWDGVVRNYNDEAVEDLRGNVDIEYSVAKTIFIAAKLLLLRQGGRFGAEEVFLDEDGEVVVRSGDQFVADGNPACLLGLGD